jgi:hypothetical protein
VLHPPPAAFLPFLESLLGIKFQPSITNRILFSFETVLSDDRNTLQVFAKIAKSFGGSEEAKQVLILKEVKNKNVNRTGPKRLDPFIVVGNRDIAADAGEPVQG